MLAGAGARRLAPERRPRRRGRRAAPPARARRAARARVADRADRVTACGVLLPIALAVFGADYLAPRNLVGAMIPLSVLIALLLVAADAAGRRARRPR